MIGLALGAYTYNYLNIELGITIPDGKTKPVVLSLLILILVFGSLETAFSALNLELLSTLIYTFLIATLAIQFVRQLILGSQTNFNPMAIASYFITIIGCLTPSIFYVVNNDSIGFLIINLAFLSVVVAYLKHYFAQINIENSFFNASNYFSELSLSDRYRKSIDVLNTYDLTVREREIGLLLLEGKTYREISDLSNVAETTIRTHASKIYQKTGIEGNKKLEQFKNKFSDTNPLAIR